MGESVPQSQGSYAYVVSASNADHFAEMAAISMASLRCCERSARIVVVLDASSAQTPGIDAINGLADEIIRVPLTHPNSIYRSRLLKNTLRTTIAGDFLYLDSDTFVLRSPSSIWQVDADVAAAPDAGDTGRPYTLTPEQKGEFLRLGWPTYRGLYLNSGVIMMRDNPVVRSFVNRLDKDWHHFSAELNRYNDQPAFNYAARMSEICRDPSVGSLRLQVLPTIWNAQVSMNEALGRRAKIVHLFTGNFEQSNDTVLHVAAKQLKRTGTINMSLIEGALAAGHIWVALDRPRKLYAAGQYGKAVLSLLRK